MNKEEAYDAKVSPLMREVIAICKEHHIPVLAVFHTPNDDKDDLFCTTALLGKEFDAPDFMVEALGFLKRAAEPAPLVMTVVSRPNGSTKLRGSMPA